MDYGAVVKKNGVIISDVRGLLFQNFTNLKYADYDSLKRGLEIDETIVKGFNYKGEPIEFSMAGNYFALVGDEHFLMGFYKEGFVVEIDKQVVNNLPCTWEWFDEHVKPLKFVVDNEIEITLSLAQKEHTEYGGRMSVYLAKFTYKGDNYEVLFGYGVDTSIIYTFTDKNYYQHKRKDYWHMCGKKYKITCAYNKRKGLKFIREWTWKGLSEEQRLIVPKKYRLK